MTAIRMNPAKQSSHLMAALNFVDRQEDALLIEVNSGAALPERNYEYRAVDVPITNARAVPRSPALDWEGFALYNRPTDLADLDDQERIEAVYYPEIETLIKDATGASDVLIFDHTIRRSDAEGDVRRVVNHVHNDYTEASAPQRVIDLLGEEEGNRRLKKRFVQINAWRPFGLPVQRSPLALADARSIRPQDLRQTTLDYGDRQGEIYELSYNYGQRWFYYPEMNRDELLLLKGFDSAQDGRGRLSPHTAFDDPNTPDDAPPRESIEVRAFAFFDDEAEV